MPQTKKTKKPPKIVLRWCKYDGCKRRYQSIDQKRKYCKAHLTTYGQSENPGSGGGALQFKTVKALEKAINKYFGDCANAEPPKPLTMTGLGRALKLSRQGIKGYKDRDKFADTIGDARDAVEQYSEELLLGGYKQSASVIFNLRANFGWNEKSSGEGELIVKWKD